MAEWPMIDGRSPMIDGRARQTDKENDDEVFSNPRGSLPIISHSANGHCP